MIIGLLLAIVVSVFLASAGMIVMVLEGTIKENLLTGSVIGATGVASYAVITLVISLIVIFFLILILRKPKKHFQA